LARQSDKMKNIWLVKVACVQRVSKSKTHNARGVAA
jgi:hypothetical protein